jgi:hypothetical protein
MRDVVVFLWTKQTKSDVKENPCGTLVRSQHQLGGDVTARPACVSSREDRVQEVLNTEQEILIDRQSSTSTRVEPEERHRSW